MAIAEVLKPQNIAALRDINALVALGCITEVNLAGLSTVVGLVAAVNAVTLAEVDKAARTRCVDAITNQYAPAGLVTDADVAAAAGASSGSRIATLQAAFTADDSNLTAGIAGGLPNE